MSSCINPSTRILAVSVRPLTSRSAISLRDFLASASRFSCNVRSRWIDRRIWTYRGKISIIHLRGLAVANQSDIGLPWSEPRSKVP